MTPMGKKLPLDGGVKSISELDVPAFGIWDPRLLFCASQFASVRKMIVCLYPIDKRQAMATRSSNLPEIWMICRGNHPQMTMILLFSGDF